MQIYEHLINNQNISPAFKQVPEAGLEPASLLGNRFWGGRVCIPPLRHFERVIGIEPTSSAWKADALPLCYTRVKATDLRPVARRWLTIQPATIIVYRSTIPGALLGPCGGACRIRTAFLPCKGSMLPVTSHTPNIHFFRKHRMDKLCRHTLRTGLEFPQRLPLLTIRCALRLCIIPRWLIDCAFASRVQPCARFIFYSPYA